MPTVLRMSELPRSRREFVELMQELYFGRIEQLIISQGDPVLRPGPQVVREILFGGDNGPDRLRREEDFVLKAQVVELFELFERLGIGVVSMIEVRHGLPFRMSVSGQ